MYNMIGDIGTYIINIIKFVKQKNINLIVSVRNDITASS